MKYHTIIVLCPFCGNYAGSFSLESEKKGEGTIELIGGKQEFTCSRKECEGSKTFSVEVSMKYSLTPRP